MLQLGAAYYPEHWPQARWPEDIRLMKEAGFTVARVGEFAWSTFEPSAGEFRFDWMDTAITLLAEAGIKTVMGTPTAAPPAWLVQQYPDLLAVEHTGRRVQFGNRCHYCVTSPGMHAASRRIVQAMAEHYGDNPNIIGWQLDNEYNRVCYCDRCRALFQEYLREQYQTLDALNEHWSTAYWSQTYSDWSQIPIPIGGHNPGLMLAFKRFFTRSFRRFQKLQIDTLRPHLRPEVWITHNFMGWFGGFNHYEMTRDLDLATWDWYIGTGRHDYLKTGAIHDLTRGFKRKNFWVMETQPGNVNWAKTNTTLDQGEARAMAWHAVAHGADAILYWQWRSALNGQEQYHGSLVDQSGQPRPFYSEVQQLGKDFAQVADLLDGAQTKASVAMLNCYESRWSIEWQKHHGEFDVVAHFNHYYRPFAARNIAVDVLSADEPLDDYKLVIAPALLILDEQRIEHLKAFVQRGGHLVLTARSGMKDRHNALLPARPPGPLAEMAGVEVEDYYALLEPVPVKGNWFDGVSRLWAERLRVLDTTLTVPVARYGPSNGWLDNQVAISVHSYGRGFCYYVGAYLDDAAQQSLLDHFIETALLHPYEAPQGVQVRTLVKGDQEIYLMINHERVEHAVSLQYFSRDRLTGYSYGGVITLAPYGVAVLTRAM